MSDSFLDTKVSINHEGYLVTDIHTMYISNRQILISTSTGIVAILAAVNEVFHIAKPSEFTGSLVGHRSSFVECRNLRAS